MQGIERGTRFLLKYSQDTGEAEFLIALERERYRGRYNLNNNRCISGCDPSGGGSALLIQRGYFVG